MFLDKVAVVDIEQIVVDILINESKEDEVDAVKSIDRHFPPKHMGGRIRNPPACSKHMGGGSQTFGC